MAEAGVLAGRNALVTGASRGIGRRIAVRLAERGARVVVAARTATRGPDDLGGLDEAVEMIRAAGGSALAIGVELGDPASVAGLIERTHVELGPVDVLVNTAAKLDASMYLPFEAMSVDEFRAQYEVNVIAQFALMKAFVPDMRRRGGGRIVNFTSRAAQHLEAGNAPLPGGKGGTGPGYGSTKAAVNRLANHIANELWADGIGVFALDPGSTTTEVRLVVGERFGFSPEGTHDADLPARAAAHLASCEDPMRYTGRVIVARDLVAELGL